MKSNLERRFYDLGRISYRGQKNVDFKFDEERVLSEDELVQLRAKGAGVSSSYHEATKAKSAEAAKACAGG